MQEISQTFQLLPQIIKDGLSWKVINEENTPKQTSLALLGSVMYSLLCFQTGISPTH